MRKARVLLCGFLMLLLLCSCAGASEQFSNADCTAELLLSGRGLTSTVTLSFENRTVRPLKLMIRDVAFNGECTGYTDAFTADPGRMVKSFSFTRSSLVSVTVCSLGFAVFDTDEKLLAEETLSTFPYGESGVRRPVLTDFPNAAVALDGEPASLLILAPAQAQDGKRILWLYNKTDCLLRLRIDRILSDGSLTDLSLTVQALPRTGQYAELVLPNPLPAVVSMELTGYTSDKHDQPAFRENYEYRLISPVSVPTVVPERTPAPQIGTVTIRKSAPVNVRDGDNTSAKKIGSAKAGNTYPCYGISPAGWYLIRLEDGTEGYVINTYTPFTRQ